MPDVFIEFSAQIEGTAVKELVEESIEFSFGEPLRFEGTDQNADATGHFIPLGF